MSDLVPFRFVVVRGLLGVKLGVVTTGPRLFEIDNGAGDRLFRGGGVGKIDFNDGIV
jgi:hypothetical protein